MAVELATTRSIVKPWGRVDLQPWSDISEAPERIGELWVTRSLPARDRCPLLFKLIFADESLSIQVHPDDAFAHTHGLSSGKTEAWYILAANADAKIAVGLTRPVAEDELRLAIKDGSIDQLVDWRSAIVGEIVLIPAGTIHAIGAGVTLAEVQQSSDATFRIYDFNRGRELQVEQALCVADTGPVPLDTSRFRLNSYRDILVENAHFVIERIDLPPQSSWCISAQSETTIFVLDGTAAVGLIKAERFHGVFVGKGDCESIEVGPECFSALVSYAGPEHAANLLELVGAVTDTDLTSPSTAAWA